MKIHRPLACYDVRQADLNFIESFDNFDNKESKFDLKSRECLDDPRYPEISIKKVTKFH